MSALQTARIERIGAIGLIALNNPPVNATSHALRAGLLAAFHQLAADPDITVIAIYGHGNAFIAGADIKEFGQTPREPMLPAICSALEMSEKPVIAVMHGPTLGGGLEVAISTHYRVALPGAITGFPEVTLGLIPGAGGTQRAPRLIGLAAGLDLITTGKRINAEQALDLGLIDQIAHGSPRDVAIATARAVASGQLITRRTSDLLTAPDPGALAAVSDTLIRTQAHLFSPHKAIEALALSTGPIGQGLTAERALFNECLDSPQRAGLVHAFFAERAVNKIPEAGATPRPLDQIGVIGGGTMGSGIATALLLAGYRVTLVEQGADALARGVATITGNLAGAVARGKLTVDKRDTALSKTLTTSTDLGDLAQSDLVIEAVFEDMAVKCALFSQLDTLCKPGAILATNTSYLDINQIAAATERPRDIVGLHFFSPAHIMRLLEVVVTHQTAPEVVATGFALAKRLRKIAVRAGVCDGFIGNRILAHFRKSADYLMIDGASPQQIDRALEGFGFAMGPFAMADLAGLDIGWANRKRLAPTRNPAERYIDVADKMCEAGWFGRKTGTGFYLHDQKPAIPNPAVADLIAAAQKKAAITPRDFTDDQIVARYMTAMMTEAVRVLADGTALRPIDIDAVFLFGYGFARHHGGPMHHADTIGPAALIARIEEYATEDPVFWRVPQLLRDMAKTGQTFSDLNKDF
jgi:3-hydroxyacyl-CoA dehydrogenase